MVKPNPPIRGHELLFEGKQQVTYTYGPPLCGCRCGARPDGWETMSAGGMKRWHRQHKADLRAGVT